ncbi:MAG: hypothetical protein AAB685_00600 [Patescibacteria group bacterium]
MEAISNFWETIFYFGSTRLSLPENYIKAGVIGILLFILALMLAQVRRHYVEWSFKGAWFGFFFGVILTLIFEGFLIVGGRTALTEVIGWKNAPLFIEVALDRGREKLVDVLGVTSEVPFSRAQGRIDGQGLVDIFQGLNPREARKAKSLICTP